MIGNYILSGRVQAIVATTALTILSLIVPPFSFLMSGAVIALIILRKGGAIGLQVLIVSSVLLQLFSIVSGLSMQLGLVYAVMIWLPVWTAAMALRLTEQQGFLILVVALLAIALVVIVYVSIGDVSGWWRQWLDVMLETAVISPDQATKYRNDLEPVIMILNAMMIAGLMLNIIIAVLYARWWQSRLFNPGGFQKEFYLLQLPPSVLVVSVMIVPLPFVLTDTWQAMFRDILIILLFMYLIQGLSAVHRNINRLKLSVTWLVLIYCLLMLWAPMKLFIACLGVVDVYIFWRRKKME